MLRTMLLGYCPACGRGRLFAGWLRLADPCTECGVRFDRYTGNWLGPTIMAYGVGAIAAGIAGLLIVPIFGFFRGLTLLLILIATTAALIAMRPFKAWWIWLMWRTGLVGRDGDVDAE